MLRNYDVKLPSRINYLNMQRGKAECSLLGWSMTCFIKANCYSNAFTTVFIMIKYVYAPFRILYDVKGSTHYLESFEKASSLKRKRFFRCCVMSYNDSSILELPKQNCPSPLIG